MPQPDKRPILFLDDDEDLLQSLRASLRRERRQWDMRFMTRGQDALASLAERPAEVVVTDMQMPEMDGATFLGHLQQQAPSTVRIVLSGQADESTTMRAARHTHQWLAKPTDRDVLAGVIRNALATLDIVRAGPAHDLVTSLEDLPVIPRVYQELTAALSGKEASIDDVASIVQSDPSAAARTLQLANSAFFGLPRPMNDVREAVAFLGFGTLAQLVFSAEILNSFGPPPEADLFELLVRRATAVSQTATAIAPQGQSNNAATSAGLLHLIGAMLLLRVPDAGDAYGKAVPGLKIDEMVALEEEMFGTTHAAVGAALLALWGVPHDLVDALARHLDPGDSPVGLADHALVVGAARRIVECAMDDSDSQPALDEQLVSQLGGSTNVQRLIDRARSVLHPDADPGQEEAA